MVTAILGPMMSGKSSELLRYLERGIRGQKRVCLVRPMNDNREYFSHSIGSETVFNNLKLDIYNVPIDNYPIDYNDMMMNMKNYDIIGIDECQFISYLDEFVKHLILLQKDIYISGLLATSESIMFEPIKKVLPYCDYIEKLNAVCTKCGSDIGSYTKYKKGNKTESVVVGGADMYTAYCSNCYFDLEKKI